MDGIRRITGSMGFKAALIAFLVLVMLIPMGLVRQVVGERADRAEEAADEIVESWGGELRLAGPLLRIPCVRADEAIRRGDGGAETVERRTTAFDLWVGPTHLGLKAEVASETRSRGVFGVPVFSGPVAFEGRFDAAEALGSLRDNEAAMLGEAELVMAIESQKGLRGIDGATWGGKPLVFRPGDAGLGLLSGGVKAAAPLESGAGADFALTASVQGGRRLRLLPLGSSTSATVSSDWPAPSFQGEYLPASRGLGDDGFSATWRVSDLSRGIPSYWRSGELPRGAMDRFYFGVDFFEALDRYALSERAAKHALLFVVVPFMTLFLLELFARRAVHPIQYLLAGVANLVFYLLLLSLSEQVPFGAAYLIAASATGGLTFLYSWSMFKDLRKAWCMAPVMGLSYLYLYAALRSEDSALLFGAIGAFAVTALVMFVTRDVDWYGYMKKAPGLAARGDDGASE
ncbi:MAG TPA: cell envelope integrity protein CreD [Spirochaetales bacterium]|nr:cell envelope integrity protein CreD [Spirochaetales bacterium]